MAGTKGVNPLTSGAIGAAAGAVIGGATTVLLTNKKARKTFVSKLQDIGDYAQDAMDAVSEVASQNQLKKVRFAGVKGGKTKSLKRKLKRKLP